MRFPRASMMMVAGICLSGCGGSDATQPNPPAATKPSADAWETAAGVSALTQPSAQAAATQEAATNPFSEKKGALVDADQLMAKHLMAQIYAELKAHKLDDAQATLDELHRLRHEKPLQDAIRFKDIPDAENAVLAAKANQALDVEPAQTGK